ncbi:MAG: cytochrome c biogenesis protein CcsA [Verrucomicrobia bacterium]|nr:cytochrome c biogenesis protein CcsA [Verrucomicrobiota bacterium]
MFSFSDRTWLWFAATLYLAGFILGTVALLRERRQSRVWMYILIVAGFTLQTVGLVLRGRAVHGCPITNIFELFQFTAWSATSLYLVIGPTFRLSLLGYFNTCLSATLTLVSLLIPAWDIARMTKGFSGSPWIEFHAALALFSYGVFGLLALTSIMYLLQVFSLQRHHLRGVFSFLPSVVDLDHINFRLLTAGAVLMSAAVAVGYVHWMEDRDSVAAIKILITGSIWLAYAVALVLRLRGILLTKRLAWTCIVLFVAALFSLGIIESNRKTPSLVPVTSQP